MSARGLSASSSPMIFSTSQAKAGSVVTRYDAAMGSCSACAMRSMATRRGSAVPSASTQTSEGPATMSMPQSPETRRLAAAT